MGITIVQKSDLSRPRPDARRALVLAGGAISGGAFKLGGLGALDRFLSNLTVNDFDIYMGISAGAFLAAPLASGITSADLVDAVIGSPGKFTRFSPLDFYSPNWREWAKSPLRFARDAATFGPSLAVRLLQTLPRALPTLRRRAGDFIAEPGHETAEALLEPLVSEVEHHAEGRLSNYLPSGLFDNRRIERYVRTNLERNGLPNTFRQLKLTTGKSLYIGATNINTAQGVVFGHDEDNSVTISEAVQASTAIPGFFKPARVGQPGRQQDYVDAAVRKTANISTAVRHGAELVICYNPFRPLVNYRHRPLSSETHSIADLGMAVIINQAFRTMLHSRLRLGIEKLRLDENFRGDVILIEPTEADTRFFEMNPLNFWRRSEASEHGFQSVKRSLTKHASALREILSAYGIECDPAGIGDSLRQPADPPQPIPRASQSRSERRRGRPLLRIVSGGR